MLNKSLFLVAELPILFFNFPTVYLAVMVSILVFLLIQNLSVLTISSYSGIL